MRRQKCSLKRELDTKFYEEWQKIDFTARNKLVNNMQKIYKLL